MPCIIPGCPNEAANNFGVRLRRPDTTAIWAPNTEAYLCDDHARQGIKITAILEPTDTGSVETSIVCVTSPTADRITPIK